MEMKENSINTLVKVGNAKYEAGTYVSDQELKHLYTHYKNVAEKLSLLGPEFAIVRRELYHRTNRCKDWLKARKEK